MSDMQIAMRLTLADLASGPLGQFVAKLEQLQTLASEITAKFNTAEKGMGGFGASAESLSAVLTNLETKLTGASDAFTMLGQRASVAGTAVEMGAGKMDAASASVNALTSNVGGLSGALKGMAELWAALEIEKGIKASVKAAADMQTQMAAMRSAGFSQDEANYARDWSERYAQTFPYASSNDVMAGRRAFVLATGQNNEQLIDAALPQVMKNAFAVSNITHDSLDHIVQNMLGISEARGLSMTPEGIIKASNLATQITEASQGRMGLQQQETVLRQSKYGGAALSSDTGIANTMAFAEQFLTAGGGGGGKGVSQAGTALSMVLKTMLGGKMNKVTAQLLQQMGLMEGGGEIGGTTTTSMNTLRRIKGSTEGETDPIGWLMQVLAPAMTAYVQKNPKAYGKSDTAEGLEKALDRLAVQLFGPTGGVNVGNLAFTAANPGTAARINEQRHRIQSSATGDDAMNAYGGTQAGQVKAFDAALKDLETSFGQTFLPIVTKVMEALTGFLQLLNGIALQFPHLTELAGVAAAGLSAFFAIKGFSTLVGGISSVVGALMKVGPAAAAAATGSGAAAAATSTGWLASAARIGGVLLRLAGAFAATFSLGYVVRNVEIAGKGIQQWLEQLIMSIFAQFDKLWSGLYQGSMGFLQKLGNAEASALRTIGLTSAANKTQALANHAGQNIKDQQAAFTARDDSRFAMFQAAQEGGKANDYMQQALQSMGIIPDDTTKPGGRAPKSAPNAQAQQLQDLLDAAGKTTMPGGLVSGGGGGGASKSKFQRIQEMIREQADKADGNPYDAMMLKYQQYADILRKGGDTTDAKKALQVGGQAANKAGYDYENQKLEQLKRELEAQKQLTAAKQEAGDLTKGQAAKQDADSEKAIAPQMAQAAQSALKYAQALKDPALAAAMQAQIEKIKVMGPAGDRNANKVDYEQSSQQLEKLQRELQAQEQLIAARVQNGSVTKYQAQGQDIAAQKEIAPQMQAAAESALKYAEALKDPELIASMQTQLEKIQAMGTGLTQMQQDAENAVQGGLTGFFEQFMKGTTSWKKMGDNLNNSIMSGMNQSISKSLSSSLTSMIFGSNGSGGGSGGSGGGGSSGSGLLGLFGSLFGGGSGGASSGLSASNSGFMSTIGSWMFSLLGGSFATGIDTVPHDMVAQIHAGERIVPASTNKVLTDALSNGTLGGGHQVNLSITAMDSQSVLGAMDGVKRELSQMLGGASMAYNLGS